jgi:hypothetical protein
MFYKLKVCRYQPTTLEPPNPLRLLLHLDYGPSHSRGNFYETSQDNLGPSGAWDWILLPDRDELSFKLGI